MKRIVRLTESDLTRIVRRVISEQTQTSSKKFRTVAGNTMNNTVTFECCHKDYKKYILGCTGTNKGKISTEDGVIINPETLGITPVNIASMSEQFCPK